MQTTALSVNINKVALLRNSRHLSIPDVARAARVCLDAGAQGVTVHPRPDERHIRGTDVYLIAEVFRNFAHEYEGERHHGFNPEFNPEFNMEGNPFDANGRFLELVREIRPAQCTLVPDSPDQATSDHGFDVDADGQRLRPIIALLRDQGIRVSVFMDADNLTGIRALAELGTDRIELYTEPYAAAFERAKLARPDSPEHAAARDAFEKTLKQFTAAAVVANEVGLDVNAGHDLNLENLPRFLREVPGVLEVSIGHALIGEAIFRGLTRTVQDYLAAINTANDL